MSTGLFAYGNEVAVMPFGALHIDGWLFTIQHGSELKTKIAVDVEK
jgi:hypothetical protein